MIPKDDMQKLIAKDDFSDLSDDQLIGLVRAALQEAVRRNPIVSCLVSRVWTETPASTNSQKMQK